MTKKEAIREIFKERAAWRRLGFKQQDWNNWYFRLRKGTLSDKVVNRILFKAGYRVVIEAKYAK